MQADSAGSVGHVDLLPLSGASKGRVQLGCALVADGNETSVVFLLGYPGVGKRTVGSHLAELLDGVLVDNQLINLPLLTLFKWDGKFAIPMEIWERVAPIRDAVLGTIEDLAPKSNSYVFTNVLKDDEAGASEYSNLRSLAQRRGSLFLSVMLSCDVDEQVRRIDNPDRIARLKGSDPEGYRRHRQHTSLFQPPPEEVITLDTTDVDARRNAETIYATLLGRGLERAASDGRHPEGMTEAESAPQVAPRNPTA